MDTDKMRTAAKPPNGATREPVGNGDIEANGDPAATDCDKLLSVHVSNGNGDMASSTAAAQTLMNHDPDHASRPVSAVCKIREELNEVICWKLRLWMIIILLLILMVLVTLVSLALCSVVHEDVDDKFDSSLFKIPHYFNGSFQMPNLVLAEDFWNISSSESQKLNAELQQEELTWVQLWAEHWQECFKDKGQQCNKCLKRVSKSFPRCVSGHVELVNVYSSSIALGRYFSKAEIFAFRNGSDITDYQLTFLLPETELESIRNHIVNREMVYNVLRQFLYDQEEDAISYIKPSSLTMFVHDG